MLHHTDKGMSGFSGLGDQGFRVYGLGIRGLRFSSVGVRGLGAQSFGFRAWAFGLSKFSSLA